MEKSEKVRATWKNFLQTALNQQIEIHQIIAFLNDVFKEHFGTDNDQHFIYNNYRFWIEWKVDNSKTVKPGDAVPIKIQIVSQDDSISYDFLEFLSQEKIHDEGIRLLEKATFQLT
ncbi:MAG: hypothetical protein R3250_07965 [Melioribacteraceae bacterium]|nr:hypothetical protein [Melioribacteraceae bacterium]